VLVRASYLDPAQAERINAKCDEIAARISRAAEAQARAKKRLDREIAEREVARSERRRQLQADASERFAPHGLSPPLPRADESTGSYRRRLLRAEQKALAPGDPFSILRQPNLSREDPATLDVLEPRVHEAFAKAVNDPMTVPEGQLREIKSENAAGTKISTFVGRESFVKSMGLPCRKVVGGVEGLRAFVTRTGGDRMK
jgi:hypothetical protein